MHGPRGLGVQAMLMRDWTVGFGAPDSQPIGARTRPASSQGTGRASRRGLTEKIGSEYE